MGDVVAVRAKWLKSTDHCSLIRGCYRRLRPFDDCSLSSSIAVNPIGYSDYKVPIKSDKPIFIQGELIESMRDGEFCT